MDVSKLLFNGSDRTRLLLRYLFRGKSGKLLIKRRFLTATSMFEISRNFVLICRSQGSPTFGALATQSSLPTFGAVAGMPGTQGFGGMQQQAAPSFGSFGGGGSQ